MPLPLCLYGCQRTLCGSMSGYDDYLGAECVNTLPNTLVSINTCPVINKENSMPRRPTVNWTAAKFYRSTRRFPRLKTLEAVKLGDSARHCTAQKGELNVPLLDLAQILAVNWRRAVYMARETPATFYSPSRVQEHKNYLSFSQSCSCDLEWS